jgi:hypothetical protein
VSCIVENSADSSRPLRDEQLEASLGIGAGGGAMFLHDEGELLDQ